MTTYLVTSVAASFNRPNDTTQYAPGDLVADSTTAGSVNPMHFVLPSSVGFKLQRITLQMTGSTATSAQFRLHLYASSPTVVNGDNAAWSTSESTYIGDFDLDATTRSFSDVISANTIVTCQPLNIVVNPTTLSINGLLEARASYTPTATQTYTVTLTGESLSA